MVELTGWCGIGSGTTEASGGGGGSVSVPWGGTDCDYYWTLGEVSDYLEIGQLCWWGVRIIRVCTECVGWDGCTDSCIYYGVVVWVCAL